VNESARNVTVCIEDTAGRRLNHRIRFWRWNFGNGRAGAIPSRRWKNRNRPGRLDSGAVADPSRFKVRIAPKIRDRSGTPCTACFWARASLFNAAMSTPSGHSLLHALHIRHRSSTSCSRESPSAAAGSGVDRAFTSALARPRVESSSLRVAM
jgi:hypothetical protein